MLWVRVDVAKLTARLAPLCNCIDRRSNLDAWHGTSIMQEDSVLCSVLEKQKVDSEQDTVRSFSLTFAGFSQAAQELSVTDAGSDQMG